MTRCLEFYEKWMKMPNFCELTAQTTRQIEDYLNLVTELETEGIPKESTFVLFSEGASRRFRTLKDNDRANVKAHVIKKLKCDLPVSGTDVKLFISNLAGGESDSQPKEKPNVPFKVDPVPTPDRSVPPLSLDQAIEPKSEKFDYKKAFPIPNSAEEMKLVQQLKAVTDRCRDAIRNPNANLIITTLENTRREIKELYGVE